MSFWKMVFAVYLANLLTIVTLMVLGVLFLIALGNSVAEFVDSPRFGQTMSDAMEESRSRVKQQMNEALKPLDDVKSNLQASAKASAAASRRRAEHAHQISEAKKMCEYWAGELRKDKSSKSEAYMDNACLRWRNLVSAGP